MTTCAITFRLVISFLLVAIPASCVACEKEVVLDIYGKPVKANTVYEVRISAESLDIGMSHYISGESPKKCTEGVKFAFPEPEVYVVFVSSSDKVRVSTKLNIQFTNHGPCSKSVFWRVGKRNSHNEDLIVLGGSKSRNDSTFTIEKSHKLYKFAFGGVDLGTVSDYTKLRLLRKPSSLVGILAEFSFYPVFV